MGRYSEPLAERYAEWLQLRPGERALDVGCGPGAMTAQLVNRLGVQAVSAVDPSPPFLASVRARFPGLDIQPGTADRLPYPDDFFDDTVASLVVHFMPDPVAGLIEMARVTKPGGRVSATVWDLAGGRAPISPLWRAVKRLDPADPGEALLPGARQGQLPRFLADAGLADVTTTEISVTVAHPTFDEWWDPYTLGVGPAGDYVAHLDDAGRAALRDECRRVLPPAPFTVTAVAWAASARV